MNLRPIGIYALAAVSVLATATASLAQRRAAPSLASSISASRVSAEIAKGKLNPAESKPGDTVTLKLQDDLRANGQIVLKKGTAFTGVVRSVKRADAGSPSKNEAAQSMLEVEWLVPAGQGKVPQTVSVTLQSVMQASPIYKNESESAQESLTPGPASPVTAAFSATRQTNHALLSMPSVVAVDAETGAEIEAGLGASSWSSPLYKVGRGQVVTANGSQQVEIYSHLENDTVITSPAKDFEINSGAQLLLLVGVNRK